MGPLITLALLFAALVFAGYITKRRFGVLGLALAAGSLISTYWSKPVADFLEQNGIVFSVPPLIAVVQIGLLLLPPVLLLSAGPTYSKGMPRVLGALAFGALAVTLLTDILRTILAPEPTIESVLLFLATNKAVIITIGLSAAVVDTLFTRKGRGRDAKKSKSH